MPPWQGTTSTLTYWASCSNPPPSSGPATIYRFQFFKKSFLLLSDQSLALLRPRGTAKLTVRHQPQLIISAINDQLFEKCFEKLATFHAFHFSHIHFSAFSHFPLRRQLKQKALQILRGERREIIARQILSPLFHSIRTVNAQQNTLGFFVKTKSMQTS